jgi:hypothetical protein
MIPTQLRNSLSSKFNLIDFVDLADLTDDPSLIFNLFKSNLKQEFQVNDIVLKKHQDSPWPEMKNILNYIQSLPDSDGTMFCKKIQWFDSIRKENFSDSHFEIANAMGYVYNKQA